MILLRPRTTFKAGRRRSPVAKITRRERAANRAAREELTAALAPLLGEVFDAFGVEAGDAVRAQLAAAVSVGLPLDAVRSLEGNLGVRLQETLADAIQRGGQIGLRFSGVTGISVSGEAATAAARRFILSPEGSRRIRQITEQTRLGVQRVVADVVTDRLSPTAAARRISSQVGLTARQTGTLSRFRQGLEQQRLAPVFREAFPNTPRGEALFETARTNALLTIDRDVDNRATRMRRDRARLIVENEVALGVQEGEREFWNEGIRRGDVDPDTLLKRWFTVQDTRVCPICAPMHGQIRLNNESFSSPLGGVFFSPPAHLRCRCFLEYGPAGDFDRSMGPPPLPPARDSIDPLRRFDTPEAETLAGEIPNIRFDQGLSELERNAVQNYVGAGFGDINKALDKRLRGTIDPSKLPRGGLESLARTTEKLDDVIGRSVLQEDWVLYRGSKGAASRWNNYEVGTVISDKGFGSWTPDRDVAISFSRRRTFDPSELTRDPPVVFRVLAPRGQNAALLGTEESEFLLPRGMKYKIVSVEENVPFRLQFAGEAAENIGSRRVVTLQID